MKYSLSRPLQLACIGDTLSGAYAVLLIDISAQTCSTLQLELTSFDSVCYMRWFAGLTAMHFQKEGESLCNTVTCN
jgi:hypothetical protein